MSYDPIVSLVIAGVLLLLSFVFMALLYRASFGRDATITWTQAPGQIVQGARARPVA